MGQFISIETRESVQVFIRKDLVAAIEEVKGSSRAEGYTKLFITGYSFSVKTPIEELLAQLEGEVPSE